MSILYKLAKLADRNNDLSKRWFIYFYYRHPQTNKFVRFREEAGINRFHTKKDRREESQEIIHSFNKMLKKGWTPFQDGKLYLDLGSTKLIEALEFSKNIKFTSARLRTKQSYSTILKTFYEWLKLEGLSDLIIKEFDNINAYAFMDHLLLIRKIANRTFNSYLTLIKSIFNELIDRDYIIKNPFKKIKKRQISIGKNIAFSKSELIILKNHLKENDYPLFIFTQFIYYCYLRPNELVNLRIRDIFLDDNIIIVPAEISKNKKQQHVTIVKSLIPIIESMNLEQYPKDYLLFSKKLLPGTIKIYRNRISERHGKILRKLNFSKDNTLYSWKHTGVVNAYKSGIDIKSLEQQLRHHSLQMTDIYLKSLGLEINNSFLNADF